MLAILINGVNFNEWASGAYKREHSAFPLVLQSCRRGPKLVFSCFKFLDREEFTLLSSSGCFRNSETSTNAQFKIRVQVEGTLPSVALIPHPNGLLAFRCSYMSYVFEKSVVFWLYRFFFTDDEACFEMHPSNNFSLNTTKFILYVTDIFVILMRFLAKEVKVAW